MTAREEVLGRVRRAVEGAAPVEQVPWTYAQPRRADDVQAMFVERVEDYRATVHPCGPDELSATIGHVLNSESAQSVVLPPGLDGSWLVRADATVVRDDPDSPLSAGELDEIDAVASAATVGIAETGTVVLDHGPDQGRRALTLVPDLHVCIVRADQVVVGVPEAVRLLAPSVRQGRPLTWISGPSATSDIELERVEGVHGPRRLHVVLLV